MAKQAKKQTKKRQAQQSGFTLIELLAVITIMGILMMVAIPSVSRTIENSRRDTFANTAKAYIDAVKTAVASDELICNDGTATIGTPISAVSAGTYYLNVGTVAPAGSVTNAYYQQTKDLMESGGKSSWGSAEVKGYVKIVKSISTGTAATANRTTYDYSIQLIDLAGRGVTAETAENQVKRAAVGASASGTNYGGVAYKTASTTVRECKINN